MNKKVVLIIDDEENILSSLKRMLRKEPYTVAVTTNPKEAFALLERIKVSLIITDQRMDGASGDDIINHVRTKYPDTKFIKLTGYCDGSGTMPNNGAFGVISKPWNDKELRLLIRSALDITESETIYSTATKQEDT